MNQQLYSIEVKGKRKTWSFDFWSKGNPDFLKSWEMDGLKISKVENIIPEWVVQYNLIKAWCWLQDHKIIPLK